MNYQQARTKFVDALGAKKFHAMFGDFKILALQSVFAHNEEHNRDHWKNFAEAVLATRDGETAEEQMDQLKHFAQWVLAFKIDRIQLAARNKVEKWGAAYRQDVDRHNQIRALEDAAREIGE